MSLKVAIQLDPLSKLNPKTDSSLLLARSAQARGYQVDCYQPQTLSYYNGELLADISQLGFSDKENLKIPFLNGIKTKALSEYDVVLIRQDPPYDISYITNTYLLEHVSAQTLVLNHPRGIRNAAEKLLPLRFKDYLPETLITQQIEEVISFAERHGDIILKPLYDYGGHSVFRYRNGEGQLKSLFTLLMKSYPGLPFIIQPFIEEVIQGDKRIILIDGDIIGGFRRVPMKGEIRANMLMGGTPKSYDISDRDREICLALKETLKQMGLFFVGLDIIGEYLIEINVTSPTGLVPLNKLCGIDSGSIFWDKVENIVDNRGKNGSQYYNSVFPGNRSSAN